MSFHAGVSIQQFLGDHLCTPKTTCPSDLGCGNLRSWCEAMLLLGQAHYPCVLHDPSALARCVGTLGGLLSKGVHGADGKRSSNLSERVCWLRADSSDWQCLEELCDALEEHARESREILVKVHAKFAAELLPLIAAKLPGEVKSAVRALTTVFELAGAVTAALHLWLGKFGWTNAAVPSVVGTFSCTPVTETRFRPFCCSRFHADAAAAPHLPAGQTSPAAEQDSCYLNDPAPR